MITSLLAAALGLAVAGLLVFLLSSEKGRRSLLLARPILLGRLRRRQRRVRLLLLWWRGLAGILSKHGRRRASAEEACEKRSAERANRLCDRIAECGSP